MGFNFKNFKKIKQEKKITSTLIAEKLNVSRKTIYNWENGYIIPSRETIVRISQVLKVRIYKLLDEEDLSELQDDFLDSATKRWLSIFEEQNEYSKVIQKASRLINDYSRKLNNATILLMGITTSVPFPLYIKNLENKYLIVNDALYKYYSLDKNYKCAGKSDFDLLPKEESKENLIEDVNVLKTGISVFNREGFIPGSKKKKTALINKIPIIDKNRKIVGLIGIFIDITERKKAEEKVSIFLNSLNETDELVIAARKAKDKETGSIEFSDFIYDRKGGSLRKIFTEEECKLPAEKLCKILESRILKYYRIAEYNLDNLIKSGRMEIRFEAKGLNGNIVFCKTKIYYQAIDNIFVIVCSEDLERRATEKIALNMRKAGIDENIIREATDILQY